MSAGEKIVLLATRTGGLNVCFELRDPSGTPTLNGGFRCSGSIARIDETIGPPGVYSILVQATGENSYALAVDRITPVSAGALPICNGCTEADEINGVGDIDFFIFNGSPGDSINLVATRLSGLNICGELFDPAGAHTPNGGFRCSGSNVGFDETLDDTGTYALMLTATGTPNYSLTLQCTGNCPPPPVSCPVTKATAGFAKILGSVYRFRNNVMARSKRGRALTRLFYQHATEGSMLMLRYPKLRRQTRRVLARIQPHLDGMVDGDAILPSRDDKKAIVSLMRAFYRKASPQLREAIVYLHREMRSGRLLSFRPVTRSSQR